MAEKDKTSPATTSCAYDAMAPRWQVIDTLLGGTEAMRAASTAYCPQHQEETDQAYQGRLAATVLTNFVEQTLDTLAGKPFVEPIKIGEDVPERIKSEILEDVDLQGNKLDVFCSQWFRGGVAKAFCHVLVDMPKPEPRTDGQPRTLADDRREGVRPYWVMIQPEAVIFARASIVGGREVLQHVRIMETYTVQDGFAEIERQRIRVLEPGLVELWEPHPTRKKDGKPVWTKVEEYTTGLAYIPLVTFYAHRESLMYGKPPLLDLAWLNIAHWQSTADQRHVLTVARFPILACSGASREDSDPITVGPNRVLYNADAQGKFYYVEHTGAAIEAGRNDLKDLEEACAQYGAQFLQSKPGDTTATKTAVDEAASSSDLARIAGVFEDAVAQALSITAEWMKLGDKGGHVEVVKQFDLEEQEANALDALATARQNRDISRKTYLDALMRAGYLPPDFDADVDAEVLLEEQDTMLARAGFNLDPLGQPTQPAEEPGQEGGATGTGTAAPAGRKPAKKASKKTTKKVTA